MRRYRLIARPEHQGQRLDQVLAEWLPGALGQELSKGKVRKLIVAGAVYLNGTRVRIASKPIRAGARIEAVVDLAKLNSDERSRDRAFEMTPERVLFEDEWIILVDKPPGLPTQPTLDEARENLFAALKKFLAQRDAVAQPYLALHHRLDRDTSGVILFAKQPSVNAAVAELFSKHRAQKTYQCLTGAPRSAIPDEWVTKNYLGKTKGPGKKTRVVPVRSGGDYAETRFRVLERLPHALWIEARPKTGRMHQIRVHLAEGGMPIIGDSTYRSRGDSTYGSRGGGPRLMLHAVNLTFPHPVTNVETSVSSPLPEDFNQCLRQLRKS